ncbi:transferase hexapeptide domain-containing [Pyrenophora seminiperda CCB06]|uniref:Dynactin subunit 6 n=1 Tax=Pyrenophora seminiperda CCB06 TaxID=1302712 RepID=A0A3M7MK62_9PLEO|nr:transferase hexapeptide domain-containing [Pyrenophora seminiperda CCB06]
MSLQPDRARPASDRRSSTAPKRTSMLPKPTSVFLDSSVLIAQHAQLTGTQPITIGPNTVLHPHCKLSSALAPVVLGEGCVVFERAKVGVGMGAELDAGGRRSSVAPTRSSAHIRESMRSEGTFLGKNVVVESNAIVEAAEVGEGSVIEVGAVVGRGSIIGKYCTISSSSYIPPNTRLPDYTVVFSGSQQRVDRTLQLRPEILDAKMTVHAKQLDMFKKLIPNNIAKWM